MCLFATTQKLVKESVFFFPFKGKMFKFNGNVTKMRISQNKKEHKNCCPPYNLSLYDAKNKEIIWVSYLVCLVLSLSLKLFDRSLFFTVTIRSSMVRTSVIIWVLS